MNCVRGFDYCSKGCTDLAGSVVSSIALISVFLMLSACSAGPAALKEAEINADLRAVYYKNKYAVDELCRQDMPRQSTLAFCAPAGAEAESLRLYRFQGYQEFCIKNSRNEEVYCIGGTLPETNTGEVLVMDMADTSDSLPGLAGLKTLKSIRPFNDLKTVTYKRGRAWVYLYPRQTGVGTPCLVKLEENTNVTLANACDFDVKSYRAAKVYSYAPGKTICFMASALRMSCYKGTVSQEITLPSIDGEAYERDFDHTFIGTVTGSLASLEYRD